MIPQEIIERLTNKISASVDRVLSSIERRDIETEPNVTDRLLANLERDFEPETYRDYNKNIVLRTRTLRDKGAKASEKIYGADLATLLDIDIEGYKLQKGFLAQSKWEKAASIIAKSTVYTAFVNGVHFIPNSIGLHHPDINIEKEGVITFDMNRADYTRMYQQAQDMLRITSDSFIFIYTATDVYVYPASAVIAGKGYKKKQEFYCKNFKLFMTDYLKSFIGDITLTGISDDDFQSIIDKKQAENVVLFQISQNTNN